MKSFLNYVKNLIPYLFLIAIYFFFINIEARKSYNNRTLDSEKIDTNNNNNKLDNNQVNVRISIPVIPYND